MRSALIALAGLLAVAAAPAAWRWRLPEGVAPPAVPADNPMGTAKVELGRRLFYDADLSVDGTMACSTCHEQHRGFADGNATHAGVHGDPGRRNVPGLANVAWLPSLTWGDPRVRTLEAQTAIPIFGRHPIEMGMAQGEAEIVRRLSADACYRAQFASAFPERGGAIGMADVSRALATFERGLVSYRAPYDAWRRGDRAALSPVARDGAAAFGRDCAGCHAGPNLTDGAFHAIAPLSAGGADPGLSEATGDPADSGRFRTPSLRNIAVTGPYLHDGTATTPAQAIRRHARFAAMPEAERAPLLAFLDTLTDRAFLADRRFALPDKACGRRL